MASDHDVPSASLVGRRALVTGASRGIGAATAVALARQGADVVLGCRRHADEAEAVADEVRSAGRRAWVAAADLGAPGGPARLARAAIEALGQVDLLVLNAGGGSRGLPIERTSTAEVERQMRLHAIGPHELLGELLPGLRAAPRADVVAISSIAVTVRPAGGAPYTMAKAALEALMATLAAEAGPSGLRVHVIAPGLVDTEQGRRLVRRLTGGPELHDVEHLLPGGRATTPADVAAAVVACATAPGSSADRIVVGADVGDLDQLGRLLRQESPGPSNKPSR